MAALTMATLTMATLTMATLTMATLTMAILPWQRDFTYVSDIVEGIIAASELGSQLEVFNLGNTRPEKVSRVHISTRASSR